AATPVAPAKAETKAVETKKEEAPVATPAVAKAAEKPAATPAVATAAPTVTAKTQAPAAAATTQVASSNKGAAIYQAALAQLGTFQDCTMLVTNALKAVGINFHDWPAGYMSLGTVVPASQAQPGDLVYYANGGMGAAHIGVYAGNGQAIHGGWNGNQTVLNTANLGSGPVYIRVK
ncbi:MAG: NlpC/P60 family protein, partial [Gemella haemolysans]|nr:NlpC/P60 family protein [Gemella haemolysans]